MNRGLIGAPTMAIMAIMAATILSGVGCGSTTTTAFHAVPDTAADPVPYAPPPQANPGTGDRLTAATVGGDWRLAREITRRFLSAILTGDRNEVGLLLVSNPYQLRRHRPMPRAVFTTRWLVAQRQMSMTPALSELIRDDQIVFRTVGEAVRRVPSHLDPTDTMVDIPLTAAGRQVWSELLQGWSRRGSLVIRERDMRVVAF